MKPMSEARGGKDILAYSADNGFWLPTSYRYRDGRDQLWPTYIGWLPLPADASDAAIRECAVAWLNSLPESEREQAKKEIR